VFERRVHYFISIKDYYTFDELDLTEEMKVLTSAAAIQLTFGFKQFWMPNLKAILIYPTSFQRYEGFPKFRGEFTEKGYVRLSWQHFEQGYLQPRDGINLGLHEMAHALEHLHEIQFVNDELGDGYELYSKLAVIELKRIRNKESQFLRSYAGTNMYEMFAVCIEYFFEVPDLFKMELPILYASLCKMMNQDPTKSASPVWVH